MSHVYTKAYINIKTKLPFQFFPHTANTCMIFSGLHEMPVRTIDQKGVRPLARLSVCPSVKRVHCNKTEKKIYADSL